MNYLEFIGNVALTAATCILVMLAFAMFMAVLA